MNRFNSASAVLGKLAVAHTPVGHLSTIYAHELPQMFDYFGRMGNLGLVRWSGKDLNNPGKPRSRPFAVRSERRTKRWNKVKSRRV